MDTRTDARIDVERIVESAYLTHNAALQRYLTGLTRDPNAAEDLAQDAFERLTTEVRAGRVPDEIGGWLHRVGHNLAMSRGAGSRSPTAGAPSSSCPTGRLRPRA